MIMRYTKDKLFEMLYKNGHGDMLTKYGTFLKESKDKRLLKRFGKVSLINFKKIREVLKKEGII